MRSKQSIWLVMREFQRLHDLLHTWQPSVLREMNIVFAKGESVEIAPELASMLTEDVQLSA